MDTVEVQLKMLIDILNEKITTLEQALALTQEQTILIKQVHYNIQQYRQIYQEKRSLFDRIKVIDDTFVDIYGKVKKIIDTNKEPYRNYVLQLQEQVTTVTDITVKIQVTEERNAKLGTQLAKHPKKVTTLTRDAISSYQKYGKGQRYFSE